MFAVLPTLVWANDYGEQGLIDIPSARMADDAEFTVMMAYDRAFDSYSVTYQALPWLEATFRYSGSFNVSPNQQRVYWDRNYGFKARLWEETQYVPEMAFGIRDLIGTGVFGSEYIVGSKRFGKLDTTFGIGWGRLAGRGMFDNPLGYLDSRFDRRVQATSEVANAGTVRNYYFRGEAGVFGGLSYQLSDSTELLAEYNPDEYDFTEKQSGISISPTSPLSVGLKWRAFPQVELGLSFQHLDQIGVSFESKFDSSALPPEQPLPTFISSLYLPEAELPDQIDKAKWFDRLLYDVERSDLVLVGGSISADSKSAELVVGNTGFSLWSDALGRHIALADLHLPATVETIYFVVEDGGHRSATLQVPRPSTVISPYESEARSKVSDGKTPRRLQNQTNFATGNVISDIRIGNRLQLFDPDDPARYQINLSLGSEYVLSNHWSIRSSYTFDLTNNFDESRRRQSDSQLPKVRTDVVNYLVEGATGLEKLFVEGRDTYGSRWHYRAFAGVLEEMFSGVGGEMLYWDTRSRLAFGVSMAYVKQRAFDKSFKHQDYEVVTGFASAYWATPWYNYDAAIHVGRYLAKDVGATLDLRRTFRNGWQVGVFATLTDVPFDVFGEGSFDKGFYFQVPLDGIFGDAGRSKVSTRVRPVQRDGGQRLEDYSGNIFWDLREARYDALVIDERMLP